MKNCLKISISILILALLLVPTTAMAAKLKNTPKQTKHAIKKALKAKNQSFPATPSTEGNWYHPSVSTTWQWQLSGPVNPNYSVDVYDIDLYDNSIETISNLKSSGKKVLCYFSAGSGENWREDFSKFDAASLGKTMQGWNDEKWLDIRTKNVMDVVTSRLDLAVTKGCDGVEPDNVDGYSNKSGFALTKADQISFNRQLAEEAHKRGLAVALKNSVELAGDLVDYFDLTVNEQCHQYNECDQLEVFTKQGKPIFNAEYKGTSKICSESLEKNMRTLILSKKLDDSNRKSCD